MSTDTTIFLDCTLRDGGYYTVWDFDHTLIQDYIAAVEAIGVDIIELGFRTRQKNGFKGACAYTTDDFIRTLEVPEDIEFGVMINASEILIDGKYSEKILKELFPEDTETSQVSLVRVACHTYEVLEAIHACKWLKSKGFRVGFNLMQVGECSSEELISLAKIASRYPLDVLYFADSLGNMSPDKVLTVIELLRTHWQGACGFHAHDNMGLGLSNALYSINKGVTWVDSTVTGMGRGAGNVKTELLAIEIAQLRGVKCNMIPLMTLIESKFEPMKQKYRWGTNAFYYLSGKNNVHPSYVQEMMSDSRYNEEDLLAVIEHLHVEGGNQFSKSRLGKARNFYSNKPQGIWHPVDLMKDKEVMLLGSGPGVSKHKIAIETYIKKMKPIVIALNTQSAIDEDLIDARIACHPVRLLADCKIIAKLTQPLITPASMLTSDVLEALSSINLLDYGMSIQNKQHMYKDTYCVLPNSLVTSYALAVASSGRAKIILLAGFDGYSSDDPRRIEIDAIFNKHQSINSAVPLLAVTPTFYHLDSTSIYALQH